MKQRPLLDRATKSLPTMVHVVIGPCGFIKHFRISHDSILADEVAQSPQSWEDIAEPDAEEARGIRQLWNRRRKNESNSSDHRHQYGPPDLSCLGRERRQSHGLQDLGVGDLQAYIGVQAGSNQSSYYR